MLNEEPPNSSFKGIPTYLPVRQSDTGNMDAVARFSYLLPLGYHPNALHFVDCAAGGRQVVSDLYVKTDTNRSFFCPAIRPTF